jgi:hypothetical protein
MKRSIEVSLVKMMAVGCYMRETDRELRCVTNKEVTINLSTTKRRQLYLKTQFVPRSKRFSSRLQKRIIWRYIGEKIAICCEINTKHTNIVWHNVKLFNFKPVSAAHYK